MVVKDKNLMFNMEVDNCSFQNIQIRLFGLVSFHSRKGSSSIEYLQIYIYIYTYTAVCINMMYMCIYIYKSTTYLLYGSLCSYTDKCSCRVFHSVGGRSFAPRELYETLSKIYYLTGTGLSVSNMSVKCFSNQNNIYLA